MAPSLEEYEDVVSNLPVNIAAKLGRVVSEGDMALEELEKHGRVLGVFRCLIADLCEQFKGGHPGGAMGMAAIGVALWKYVMRYSPLDPSYFNRDRFVLSNGRTRFDITTKEASTNSPRQATRVYFNTHLCTWSDTRQ